MKNDNEMKEMKNRGNAAKELLKMFAEISKEPSANIFKVETINLNDKLNKIALNMKVITDDQYKELTNIVNQFEKVVDDFITENNINLKEED